MSENEFCDINEIMEICARLERLKQREESNAVINVCET